MLSITCSIDDGSIYDYKLAEVLDKHNIETTYYLPVNWQKYLAKKGIEPMTYPHALSIAKRFVIGSHGVNHELLTRVDDATQNKEIFESRTLLQGMFKQPVKSFCFPRGYYDKKIIEKVKAAGYTSARTVKVGNLSPFGNRFEMVTTVHVGYDRAEYGTDWYTYAENQLTRAVAQSTDKPTRYHFWLHGEECYRLGQWDRLLKFIKMVSLYA